MRNVSGTCGFLLLSSIMVAGQAPAKHGVVILLGQRTQGCPVALSANRLPGGNLMSVRSGKEQAGPALRVDFRPATADDVSAPGHTIVSARITLHGMNGHQMVPAGGGAGDATEERTLSPTASEDQVYGATVSFGGLTAVTSVELEELTYADGTQWHEAARAACQVTPNGYRFVADAR